ncbi:MAG: putative Histidine kinase [Promethearchaeota archaeon]|nr:MAG: putative Histidine kinase [Candidatus Lokiarchaeota archaeon]
MTFRNIEKEDGLKNLAENKSSQDFQPSAEFFELLVNTAPAIIFTVDREYRIKYINNPPAGIRAKDAINKNVLNYVAEQYKEMVRKKINTVFETGKKEEFETEARGPYDSVSYYSTTLGPIYHEETVCHVILITHDITKRRNMERKLKISQKKYEQLFNTVPYAILLAELDGTVIDINDTTELIFGYPREEIIGKKFFQTKVFTDNSLIHILERFKRLLKEKTIEPSEYLVFKKNGEKLWVSVQTSLITLENKTIIQSIVYDITERKNYEEHLKQINNLRSELFKRISHQLKAPLTSIIGYAALFLESSQKKLNQKEREYIDEIKKAERRLEADINEILKLTEVTSHKLSLEIENCDIIEIIEEVIHDLKSQIILKGHTIKENLHEQYILPIDRDRIYDVINNILDNAIKYTPAKGIINIKTALEEDTFIFSIADNGIGLLEEEQERLFKQFERLNQSENPSFSRTVPQGSGLGLYISKKIIERHKGRIWVSSEGRNKGSTFNISLPIKRN